MRHYFCRAALKRHSSGAEIGPLRPFCAFCPTFGHPGGVQMPSSTGALPAPTGSAPRLATRLSRAVNGAVNLATVTAAADDDLPAAPGAHKLTTRRCLSLAVVTNPT